ncbi:DHCW motif cupin fold protein [Ohtaekwangia sp.]|uniref:DHCW motif cupin fold protein n=1 Tax=Ohtaekwangia sp. TaxID=2066019 RepID=UPI002FDE2E2C
MQSILFQTTDWAAVPVTEHRGEQGTARWRTRQFDGLRIRLVEYSAGYKADHWCKAGHIVYCIEGEMISELADGRTFTLSSGMTYQVSDNVSMHRSYSEKGVKLLIIDGDFLNTKKETERILNPWRI